MIIFLFIALPFRLKCTYFKGILTFKNSRKASPMFSLWLTLVLKLLMFFSNVMNYLNWQTYYSIKDLLPKISLNLA